VRLDEEVFAVILAITVVGSVFAIAQIIPHSIEPFTAIGLLDAQCKIGEYPRHVIVGEPVTLCIFVDNHLGKVGLFQIRMKLGSKDNLPTNTTPLNSPTILSFSVVLGNNMNVTRKVTFTLNETGINVAIVFELWRYDTAVNDWVYDGKWVHLYVNVTEVIPP